MNPYTISAAAILGAAAVGQTLAMSNAQGELIIQLVIQVVGMILAFLGGKRHGGGTPTDPGGAGDSGADRQ